MKSFENKKIKKYFDENVLKNYTEDEYDEVDLSPEHLDKAFTNKKYYLSMKLLPLSEKKVLYYSVIEDYTLQEISKKMKISKKQINFLKKKAIMDFKKNLKKIMKGDRK